MEKKYISELNKEELEKVFEENSQLRTNIQEDMEESELHWVGEQLNLIRNSLSDWCVGSFNYRNKIVIKDYFAFIDGAEKMHTDYCTIGDSEEYKIQNALALKNQFSEMDAYTDEYEALEEEFEKACEEVAEEILKVLVGNLEATYEEEYQLDYFLDFYAESRLGDDFYILVDENGDTDYTLYENIQKSYR